MLMAASPPRRVGVLMAPIRGEEEEEEAGRPKPKLHAVLILFSSEK